MTHTKEQWEAELARHFDRFNIYNIRPALKSPQFSIGRWDVAFEHQRNFGALALKWTGPQHQVPKKMPRWSEMSQTDLRKGWHYRIFASPSELGDILAELESSSHNSDPGARTPAVPGRASIANVPPSTPAPVDVHAPVPSPLPVHGAAPGLDSLGFSDADIVEGRRLVERQIQERQGQPRFRAMLMSLWRTCPISGCDVDEALEAAHLVPVASEGGNRPDNGILLRSDLHTLFDRGLLGIDPDTLQVRLAPALEGSVYRELAGKVVVLPAGVDPVGFCGALNIRLSRARPSA